VHDQNRALPAELRARIRSVYAGCGDAAIDSEVAEESGNLVFAHLLGVTFVVKKDSPREIVSQARLQVTFPPRTLKIFLTTRCVASIKTAFPVYQFEGRSSSCGHDEPGVMGLYASWKLVS
jgi:hypothetical protein